MREKRFEQPETPWSGQARRERVIVALDCGADEARELARALAGHASWVKVGMTLYYQAGPSVVAELKDAGFKVFVDLKLHDIPHQVAGAASSLVAAGADMFTMHALGGAEMMAAAARAGEAASTDAPSAGADDLTGGAAAAGATAAGASATPVPNRPISLAVSVLTSMDEVALQQVGVERSVAEEAERLALLAAAAGVDGMVCSPHEAAELRKLLGPRAAIVTPGIRAAAVEGEDQSRVATPAFAFDAGASHIVVGRPVTQAPDPLAAFEALCKGLD